jgi:hypothetical protein
VNPQLTLDPADNRQRADEQRDEEPTRVTHRLRQVDREAPPRCANSRRRTLRDPLVNIPWRTAGTLVPSRRLLIGGTTAARTPRASFRAGPRAGIPSLI